MKKYTILAAVLLAAGCAQKQDPAVLSYAAEELGLSGVRITETREFTDDAGHTDIRCTLRTQDGIEFHVLKDMTEGLDGLTEYLWDDYRYEVLVHSYRGLSRLRTAVTESAEGMIYAELYGEYAGRKDLEQLCSEVRSKLDGSLLVNIRFVHSGGSGDEADEQNAYTRLTDEDVERIGNRYLHQCIAERSPDLAQEYTEEEIQAYVAGNEHRILYGTPDDPEVYPDLLAEMSFRGLSFPTVYTIMEREEMLAGGTPEQFSFYGTDGLVLELKAEKNSVVTCGEQEYVLQNPGHIRTIELRVLTGRFYAEQYELDQGWDVPGE